MVTNSQYILSASDPSVLRSEMDGAGKFTSSYLGDLFYQAGDELRTDDIKWYEHEADLREVSRRWPGVIFTLAVLREDGERWRKYFLNGKMQSSLGVVTFEPFDSSKLT